MRYKLKAADVVTEEKKRGGYGDGQGGKGWHRKARSGKLMGGNGCKAHPDCFTCPFGPDDCRWESKDNYI